MEVLSGKIKEAAIELGYDLCGVISADSFGEFNKYLDERIEQYPHSRKLYEPLRSLGKPLGAAEWTKSVVVCIRRYSKYKIPEGMDKFFGKIYLFDGRVEHSKEYEAAVKFESCLKDMSMKTLKYGVSARWAAIKAGLGTFGRNNFVYTKHGSWVWVDTWLVDKVLEYDAPSDKECLCPENCTKCIDACPTKALSAPYSMDRGKCIAHLSFYSTVLPEEALLEQMGTWIYGCDACQDACPRNKNKFGGEEEFPGLNDILGLISPESLFEMDERTFLEIIQLRFWYINKESIWLWRCNALRVMVNSGEEKYHECIKNACSHSDERIRNTAEWGCRKLGI